MPYQSTLGQQLGGLQMAQAQGEANLLRQGGQAAAQRWTNFGQLGSLPISTMKQMHELEDRKARLDYMQTQADYMGMLGDEAKVRRQKEERLLANTTMYEAALAASEVPSEDGGPAGRDWEAGIQYLHDQGRPDLIHKLREDRTTTVTNLLANASNELQQNMRLSKLVGSELQAVLDPETGSPAEWARRRDTINGWMVQMGREPLPEVYDEEILMNQMKAGVELDNEWKATEGLFNTLAERFDASDSLTEFELAQKVLGRDFDSYEQFDATFSMIFNQAPRHVQEAMVAAELHKFDETDPAAYRAKVDNFFNPENPQKAARENYNQYVNDWSKDLAGLIEARAHVENVINGIEDRVVGSPAPTYGKYGNRLFTDFFGDDVPGDMQFPYTKGPLERSSQRDRLKPLFDQEVLKVFNEFRRKQGFTEWAQLPDVEDGFLLLRAPTGQEQQVSVLEAQPLLDQGATISFNPEWLGGMPRWLPNQTGTFPTTQTGTTWHWGYGPSGGPSGGYGTTSVGVPQ